MNRISRLASFIFAVAVLLAIAATVHAVTPVVESVTLSTTAGTGSWTNTWILKGAKLVSVEYFNGLNATNTITLTRVRDTRTNTVCTVVLAAGVGTYNEVTNTVYFFRNDVLNFSSSIATGSVAEITFEVSP